MKRSITKNVIPIVILFSTVSFGYADLSGQYWFGSLSVNDDGSNPLGKRGTVSITGDQWIQQWEDRDGDHESSSAFNTAIQPDGSINVNFEDFPDQIYNVAWNGDMMIHAGTVLHGGGEGIDIFTRKASEVDVNDFVGRDSSYFAHWLGTDDRRDEAAWGTAGIDANGLGYSDWVSSAGYREYHSATFALDDANSVLHSSIGLPPTLLGESGISLSFQEVPDIGPNLGYYLSIEKTDEMITITDIAGTYQVRSFQTGPGAVPYTCGQGTCVIEALDDANGIMSMDAYFSNGEHDVSFIEFTVGPGNEFHIDDDGVPDGIVSSDKNLIFAPEYRYKNPPMRTEDDWIGGIFLIRMPNNIIDPNGWVYETPMNVARDQFAGGVINGKIYVFGGNGNPDGHNLNSTEVYDPATIQWRMLADNNHSDWGVEELTSAVVDDKFYVFGVYGDIGFNEMYDPVTNEWTTLAKKPTKVVAGPTTVYENEIYVFGGYSDSDDPSQDAIIYQGIESYNPSTNTWRYVTDMPLQIADFGIATLGTKAYLFGGNTNKSDRQFFDDVITYDFETDEWTMTGYQQMPVKKRFMYSNSAPVIDGKVYLIGTMREDIGGQFVYCDRIDIYDPVTNTWREGPSLPHPLDGHVTLSMGSKIYLIGGYNNYDFDNRAKAEVISLDTNFCSP